MKRMNLSVQRMRLHLAQVHAVAIALLFCFVNPAIAESSASVDSNSQLEQRDSGNLFVQSQRVESTSLTGSVLHIETNRGQLTITALNNESVEVFYQPEGVKQLPSFAISESDSVAPDVSLTQFDDRLTFALPELNVDVYRAPLRLVFKKGDIVLAQEEVGLFVHDTVRGFRFLMDDSEKMLGGGQRVLGMDRRGHRMPLYNRAHYGYSTESNQMYYSLPAIMSSKNYIIAFDNSASGFLDIGHTQENVLQFEAVAGRTSYIFSAGDNSQELVENFVSITGKQPLPPRWALGNYASRFGYRSQQETLDTIDKFIEQDFPVDAVVLDLFWFGPDIKGHMGNLQWHKPAFPEPEKMIQALADKGVKTILITEPFILSSSSQWDSAVANQSLAKNLAGGPRRFDFYFGNTGLVDVFDSNAQDWFWQYYEKLNEQGVAGWWGDLGEPEVHPGDSLHNFEGQLVTGDKIHNVYGHKWAQMVYERQLQMRPDERPFVMMRSGFLGTQRYGMIPWTGDVERSWNGLKPQVELALQMSLFGLAYTHSDLGGFAGGEAFDSELYVRWMQYGVFQGVYRPHAQDHIPPEPIFHDQSTQDLVRPFVKLRYQLMPYNYSMSMQNSMTGVPLMRPLFMMFEDEDISRTDAYMWGESLLVSPVVSANVSSQTINLPEGVWFNFFGDGSETGKRSATRPLIYQGGSAADIPTPMNEIPVLVKAGAFIPMVDSMQNTQGYSTERLRVRHYTHASIGSGDYSMLEDDGTNPNSLRDAQYQSIHFKSARSQQSLVLSAKVDGNYAGAPGARRIIYSIYGLQTAPTAIELRKSESDPHSIQAASGLSVLDDQDGMHWDEYSKVLTVSFELSAKTEISFEL
ncbi:TIM-barrel domain-containing protein [Ningiella sp. W23]|uniref:TIM-barrel domain-containing protein n=1 Tax=Ningiella sp. W23 TaxID=3023715 RepID=UPI003756F761